MKIKKSKRKGLFVLIVLTLINAGLAGIHFLPAKNNSEKQEKTSQNLHPRRGKAYIIKTLEFDEKQIMSFQQIHAQYRNEMFDLQAKQENIEGEMLAEMKKNSPDTIQLYNYSNEIGKIQTTIKIRTIEHMMEIKKLCNTSQLHKYEQLLDEILIQKHENIKGKRKMQNKGNAMGYGRNR